MSGNFLPLTLAIPTVREAVQDAFRFGGNHPAPKAEKAASAHTAWREGAIRHQNG